MEKFIFKKALETASNETDVLIGLKSGMSINTKKENIHIKEEQSPSGVVYQYVCVESDKRFVDNIDGKVIGNKQNVIYFELKNVESVEIVRNETTSFS
jgi:hypothetical protein